MDGTLVSPTAKATKDGGFFMGEGGSKSDAESDQNLSHLSPAMTVRRVDENMGCINALIAYTVVIAPVWGDKNIDEVLMRKVTAMPIYGYEHINDVLKSEGFAFTFQDESRARGDEAQEQMLLLMEGEIMFINQEGEIRTAWTAHELMVMSMNGVEVDDEDTDNEAREGELSVWRAGEEGDEDLEGAAYRSIYFNAEFDGREFVIDVLEEICD